MTKKSKLKDFTVHMRRKDGKKVTAKEARAALWVAYKLARDGQDLNTALKEWHIEGIDWHNDDEKIYNYGSERAAEILVALGGVLHTINWNKDLRIEVPDSTLE